MPRYEYIAGSSAKFWEVTVDGCDVTTHWGRIGTNGQSKTKTLASPEREAPPPIGSVITFRYQELTRDGVPRFPSFLRVCEPG